jgi:hypothetical protein
MTDPETTDSGLVAHLSLWGINPTSIECVRRTNGQLQVVFRFIANEEFRCARKAYYAATRSGHELIKKHTSVVNMVRQMTKDATNDRCS